MGSPPVLLTAAGGFFQLLADGAGPPPLRCLIVLGFPMVDGPGAGRGLLFWDLPTPFRPLRLGNVHLHGGAAARVCNSLSSWTRLASWRCRRA